MPDFCFITGVLPMFISELASSTNDITPLALNEAYAGALGLPRKAVRTRLIQIAEAAYAEKAPSAARDQKQIDAFVETFEDFMMRYFHGFCFFNPGNTYSSLPRYVSAEDGADWPPSRFNTQQVTTFFRWMVEEGTAALEKLERCKKELSTAEMTEHASIIERALGTGINLQTQVRDRRRLAGACEHCTSLTALYRPRPSCTVKSKPGPRAWPSWSSLPETTTGSRSPGNSLHSLDI